MSTNLYAIENKPFLELNVDSTLELRELTAQVIQACQRAEELHSVFVINIADYPSSVERFSDSISIQDVNRWEQAVRRVERFAGITIVHASGTLNGPGFDLFLAADYRVAKSNIHFVLPGNQQQVWPGMLMYRLVQQIGMAKCRQLVLGSRSLTADYALDIGLIDEISDNIDIVDMLVAQLLPKANKEYAIRRQLMLEATTTSYDDALGAHLAACDRELRRLGNWEPFVSRASND